MPTKTKGGRREIFGEPVWATKTYIAARNDESLYTVDRKIRDGIYEAAKDPTTGAIRILVASTNPKNFEFEPPPEAA